MMERRRPAHRHLRVHFCSNENARSVGLLLGRSLPIDWFRKVALTLCGQKGSWVLKHDHDHGHDRGRDRDRDSWKW